jgi:hypothetical protein
MEGLFALADQLELRLAQARGHLRIPPPPVTLVFGPAMIHFGRHHSCKPECIRASV